MNFSLTEGLAIAGGLALAAVVAHGAWSTRRAAPRRPDAPVGGERREPVLGQQPAPDLAQEPTLDAATVPGSAGTVGSAASGPAGQGGPGAAGGLAQPSGSASGGPAEPAAPGHAPVAGVEAALARMGGARRTARLDPLIDAIGTLTLEAPVTGEAALMHMPTSRRAGTKPFLIEGLNADSDEWELPAPGRRYAAFQAGVQLANRHGALNEIEYSEFVQKLQGFADGVGAMVELPDMLEAVAQARELDAFAGAHDAQLTLTLRANAASWTVSYLQQTAARHGFLPGAVPGRLVYPGADEGAPPVLVLGFDAQAALADDPNSAAVRKLQLSLDVPQTPESAEPFPLWHETARRLAADIDALMVDDEGRAVTLHAFVGIGEDLKLLYQKLAERELSAGSAAARRLFS